MALTVLVSANGTVGDTTISALYSFEFDDMEQLQEWIDRAPRKKPTIFGPDTYIEIPKLE